MLKSPRLNEIVSRNPVTVSPDCPLSVAFALMATENMTAIAVIETKLPVGILTERDLLRILSSGLVSERGFLRIMGIDVRSKAKGIKQA